MGNCINHQAAAVWADDGEWDSCTESVSRKGGVDDVQGGEEERESLLQGAGSEGTREVRIKLSRRQLEELLRCAQGGGPSAAVVGEVLARLAGEAEGHHHDHAEHHWRPALQSIPEGVEERSVHGRIAVSHAAAAAF